MKMMSRAVMKPKMAVPSARAQPSSQRAVDLAGSLRLAGDGLAGLAGGKSDSDTGTHAGEHSQSRSDDCDQR